MIRPILTNRLDAGYHNIDRAMRNDEPESPCVNVCKMEGGLCAGCYRTKAEIADWARAGASRKWKILLAVAKRRLTR